MTDARHRFLKMTLATTLLLAAPWASAQWLPHAPRKPMPVVQVVLHGARFTTQVAADDDSRAYGLMNRTQLAPHAAMLFVFQHAAPRWFWMKDTKVPLDMLFFDARRRLVSMQLDATPCTHDPCAIYPSGKAAMYVLEIAAGRARAIGAQTGDVLQIHGDYGAVQP